MTAPPPAGRGRPSREERVARFDQTAAAGGTSDRTVCPRCLSVIPVRARCPRCFAELERTPPLPPEEVARRLAAHDEAARREAARRFHRPRRRTVVLAAMGVVLVLIAFSAWNAWFRPVPLVPLPSTPSLAVVGGPDAWPAANGDLGATRATTAPAHLDGAVAWSVDLGADVVDGVTTDGRVLVAALADGRVRALAAEDGHMLWELTLPNAPWAAPTIAGGLVFVAERSGRVAAYDLATGTQRWAVQTGDNIATPALVGTGVAYVYAQTAVYAFDAATGRELWHRGVPRRWAVVTPALEGHYLALTTNTDLRIFDLRIGRQSYYYRFAHAEPFGVSVRDGAAYGVSWRLAGAFDVTSGNPWWEGARAVWERAAIWRMAPTPRPAPSLWLTPTPLGGTAAKPPTGLAPALGDGAWFVATTDGQVRALDRAGGAVRWQQALSPLAAPPTLTGDGLLLVAPAELRLLDTATGETVATRAFTGPALTAATVTRGGTYVTTAGGTLVALR